uniref:Lipoprotein n=1 Tax=Meloidogyne hapla TaxID=6305 RepID=A0A1I8AY19_MELHA
MTKFSNLLFIQIIILINCQPPLHNKLIIEHEENKCEFKEIDEKNKEHELNEIPILFYYKSLISHLVFLFGRNNNLYFTLWQLVVDNCKEINIYEIKVIYSNFNIVEMFNIKKGKYCNVGIKEETKSGINYNFYILYKSEKNIFGNNSDTFIFDKKNKIVKIFTNPIDINLENESKWIECRKEAKKFYGAEFIPKQNIPNSASSSNQKSGVEIFKEMRKKVGNKKL